MSGAYAYAETVGFTVKKFAGKNNEFISGCYICFKHKIIAFNMKLKGTVL
jgi:hypothetical protein